MAAIKTITYYGYEKCKPVPVTVWVLVSFKSLSKWDTLLPTEPPFSPQNIQEATHAGLLQHYL